MNKSNIVAITMVLAITCRVGVYKCKKTVIIEVEAFHTRLLQGYDRFLIGYLTQYVSFYLLSFPGSLCWLSALS